MRAIKLATVLAAAAALTVVAGCGEKAKKVSAPAEAPVAADAAPEAGEPGASVAEKTDAAGAEKTANH